MIDDFVQRFLQLKGAEITYGPEHPTSPKPAYAPILRDALEIYPFLHKYSDYIELLTRYGGIHIMGPQPDCPIESPDYFFFSVHDPDILLDPDEVSPDAMGLLPFAIEEFRVRTVERCKRFVAGTAQVTFLFDPDESKPPGVYFQYFGQDMEQPDDMPERLCDTFSDFLKIAISCGGRILPGERGRQFRE